MSQEKAAERLGVHRSALSLLLNGDFRRFALGSLVDIAVGAGVPVQIRVADTCQPAQETRTPLPEAPAEDEGPFTMHPRDEAKHRYAASRDREHAHTE